MKKQFPDELNLILKQYSTLVGVELHHRSGVLRRFRKLVQEALLLPKEWSTYGKRFSGIVKLIPFIGGLFITIFLKIELWPAAITVAVTTAILYAVGLALETIIPKDIGEHRSAAQLLEMELALQKLATQVALYSSLANISYDDDRDSIRALSKNIESQVHSAITSNWDTTSKLVDPNRHNDDVWKSAVSIKEVDQGILDKFSRISELITEVSTVAFGYGDYTVKLYIRTAHEISHSGQNAKIELLTSMGRHPKRKNQDNSTGRSWLQCNGHKAKVWHCLNTATAMVCDAEPKGPDGKAQYESLVHIPLPDGLGVVTIESNEKGAFGDTIPEDLEKSIQIVTRTLVRELI